LGRVLVEQEGNELLEAEERIRLRSRDARETGDADAVRDAVRMLSPVDQANVLRAFGLYFQLVNIAEQHHRLRRRRQYAADDQRAPRESLADAFERLRDVDANELRTRVSRLSLELVLTAHPTEATRRTYLLAHVRVATLLAELDATASAREEERIESELGPGSPTRSGMGSGSSRTTCLTEPSACSPSIGRTCRTPHHHFRSEPGSAATWTAIRQPAQKQFAKRSTAPVSLRSDAIAATCAS
jgi:hypothetical protein